MGKGNYMDDNTIMNDLTQSTPAIAESSVVKWGDKPIYGSFVTDDSNREMPMWKRVSIGGVACVAIGAAAAWIVSELLEDGTEVPVADDVVDEIVSPAVKEAEEINPALSTEDAEPSTILPIESPLATPSEPIYEIKVAYGVNDDMTFSEAFATARQEVGPSGVFEWNGGTYGTYYADEWDAMSPESRSEWSAEAMTIEIQSQPASVPASSVEEPMFTVEEIEPEAPEEVVFGEEFAKAENDIVVDDWGFDDMAYIPGYDDMDAGFGGDFGSDDYMNPMDDMIQ